MPADSVNRETIRDALSTLLYDTLVTGGVTDKEFGYKTADFGQPVSAVVVTSAGTRRVQNPGEATCDVWVLLDVWTFTLESDEAQGWTRADAEDKRDLIEKKTADVYADNYSTSNWLQIEYDGDTEAGEGNVKELGGGSFLIERIPTRVHVPQG